MGGRPPLWIILQADCSAKRLGDGGAIGNAWIKRVPYVGSSTSGGREVAVTKNVYAQSKN